MEFTLLEIIENLKDKGYKYLGYLDEYVNSNSKVVCMDTEGYLYNAKPSVIKRGESHPCKVDPSNPYSIYNINLYLKRNNKGFIVIDYEYVHSSRKLKCLCTENTTHGIFYKNWGQISSKGVCPKCRDFNRANKIPPIDESVFYLRNDLVKYFKSPNDSKLYKLKSNKEVGLICPECKFEKIMRVYKLTSRGFSCNRCSDGVSMPEKIMINILSESAINFETQKRFKWAKNKYYDFYIEEYNMIIETHGVQHYSRKIHPKARSVEEEILNDVDKRNLAKNNGIEHYIEINCSELNFDNFANIYLEKIRTILDIRDLDFSKIWENSLSSNVVRASNMFMDGVDLYEISKILKVHKGTVVKYLNKGSEINLCDYDGNKRMRELSPKGGKANGIPVCKLDLDKNHIETYNSFTEAGEKNNISSGSIVYASNNNKVLKGHYWVRVGIKKVRSRTW